MLKKFLVVITLIIVHSLALAASADAFGDMATADPAPAPVIDSAIKEVQLALRDPATGKIDNVSLFSENERDRPVAAVNGEPITLGQFARELAVMHNTMSSSADDSAETAGQRSFSRMLERLINIKLVKQEALNIGFDRTPDFQSQMEAFRQKTLVQLLLARQVENLEVDADEIEALYSQMALEARTRAYRFDEQAVARELIDQVTDGADFRKRAEEMVAAGTAEGGGDESEYLKLSDMLPNVAKAVYEMDSGDVSPLFSIDEGFLVFQMLDKRVYEDAAIREQARQRLFEERATEVKRAYLSKLIDDNVSFNETAMQALEFAEIFESNPDTSLKEVIAELEADQRILASIDEPEEQLTLSVAEVAGAIRQELFHGLDRKIDPVELNNQKVKIIQNRLLEVLGPMEAGRQGIDASEAYQAAVDKKYEGLLFDYFVNKAVMPEIKVMEDEAKEYYQNNVEDFTGPLMLKLKSLAFTSENAARTAYEKLQAGSDFQWVSANSPGQAAADHKDRLNFGGNLLAQTALPEDLQPKVAQAMPGDSYYYAGPDDLYYTLMVERVFPPQVESYEEVREKIGGTLYGRKIRRALDEWIGKLKEAYETEMYIVPENQG